MDKDSFSLEMLSAKVMARTEREIGADYSLHQAIGEVFSYSLSRLAAKDAGIHRLEYSVEKLTTSKSAHC